MHLDEKSYRYLNHLSLITERQFEAALMSHEDGAAGESI